MGGFVLTDPLALLALCADPDTWMSLLTGLTSGRGIAVSLFVAGLASGFTHCSGMCGPFVLMRVVSAADGCAPAPVLRRIGGASLWRYHVGRGVTYSALGGVAAATTGAALDGFGFRWVLVAILVGLAVAITLTAMRGTLSPPNVVSRAVTAAAARASRMGDFPLGLALGFLPCGILYGALAAAASTGDPLAGAAAMAAFVLGTVPGLVAVGIGGAFFARRFPIAKAASMPLLGLNIAILTMYALKAFA